MSSFRTAGDADLPPVLRSLGRSMRLAYQAEPRLLVVSFLVMSLSWLPDAFGALWLKLLANGVLEDRTDLIRWAAGGLAAGGCCAPSAPGWRCASATGPPSSWRPTWPASRARSPCSSTTSAPSTSTGSSCCASRCSCSTTCTRP